MTKQEFEKFLDELEKNRKMVCKHEGNDCDHNRCMASINGCYGDECAFDVVIESIERLESGEKGQEDVEKNNAEVRKDNYRTACELLAGRVNLCKEWLRH